MSYTSIKKKKQRHYSESMDKTMAWDTVMGVMLGHTLTRVIREGPAEELTSKVKPKA